VSSHDQIGLLLFGEVSPVNVGADDVGDGIGRAVIAHIINLEGIEGISF
jgi:hypothetical protein